MSSATTRWWERPTRRRLLTTSIVSGMLVLSCSSGSDSGDGPAHGTSSTNPPPPSAPVATTTSDLLYMTAGDTELLIDVYVPSGDGPWPTVVAFHGRSSAGRGSADIVAIAEEAVERGMVVFVPTWLTDDALPITIDSIDLMADAGNCAVAFAQQHAAEFGGSPDRVALYGFSAGTGPVQRAVLDPSSQPVPGCVTGVLPAPVDGVVLGDGEYFWHSEAFDDVFRDHPAALQDAVASMTDPSSWPADLDARFRLWSAAEGTAPRPLAATGSDDDWLVARDPDGSIRRDLEALGLLDDDVVDYLDAARLLQARLASAGIDVDLDASRGGHTSADKASEIVDALGATLEGS